MTFLLGLVAGLILGWVVEWVIDRQFWRPEANETAENERKLRTELKQAQNEISVLQEQLSEQPKPVSHQLPDLLEEVDGISPEYAHRLRSAGITNVSELADATPETLRNAIGAEAWQAADTESWVAQAQTHQPSKGK